MLRRPVPDHLRLHAEVDENGETRHHSDTRGNEVWKRLHTLGRGAYGFVWKEQCTAGSSAQQLRAVKMIRRRHEKSWRRELNAMARFSEHVDHFVQVQGWYEDVEHLYIAMEFMEYGTMYEHVAERSKPLDEEEAVEVVKQVAQAVQLMHRIDFLHRDLKPQNILVARPGPQWHVKLADFGIAKDISSMGVTANEQGTLGYMAPEVFLSNAAKNKYSKAGDIWAIGVISFFLLTKTLPFRNGFFEISEYFQGKVPLPTRPLDKRRCTNLSMRFIESALRPKPEERPAIDLLLQHQWILPDIDSFSEADTDEGDVPWAPGSNQWANTWDAPAKHDSALEDTKRACEDDELTTPMASAATVYDDAVVHQSLGTEDQGPYAAGEVAKPGDNAGVRPALGISIPSFVGGVEVPAFSQNETENEHVGRFPSFTPNILVDDRPLHRTPLTSPLDSMLDSSPVELSRSRTAKQGYPDLSYILPGTTPMHRAAQKEPDPSDAGTGILQAPDLSILLGLKVSEHDGLVYSSGGIPIAKLVSGKGGDLPISDNGQIFDDQHNLVGTTELLPEQEMRMHSDHNSDHALKQTQNLSKQGLALGATLFDHLNKRQVSFRRSWANFGEHESGIPKDQTYPPVQDAEARMAALDLSTYEIREDIKDKAAQSVRSQPTFPSEEEEAHDHMSARDTEQRSEPYQLEDPLLNTDKVAWASQSTDLILKASEPSLTTPPLESTTRHATKNVHYPGKNNAESDPNVTGSASAKSADTPTENDAVHETSPTKVWKYSCSGCVFSCDDEIDLGFHLVKSGHGMSKSDAPGDETSGLHRSKTQGNLLTCPDCHRELKNEAALQVHYRLTHGKSWVTSGMQRSNSESIFTCPDCPGRSFLSERVLESHFVSQNHGKWRKKDQLVHTDVQDLESVGVSRRYTCELCFRTYDDQTQLDDHYFQTRHGGDSQLTGHANPVPGVHRKTSTTSKRKWLLGRSSIQGRFGLPLRDLRERDGTMVPIVVTECVKAITLHGRDKSDIYRAEGQAKDPPTALVQAFNTLPAESARLELKHARSFKHDAVAVSMLLIKFLMDMPGHLLPAACAARFLESASSEEKWQWRINIRHAINSIPDENYATMRLLVLHLKTVEESTTNTHTVETLATVFGRLICPIDILGLSPEFDLKALRQIAVEELISYANWIFGTTINAPDLVGGRLCEVQALNVSCDECGRYYKEMYLCRVCRWGEAALCTPCVYGGRTCLDKSHRLVHMAFRLSASSA